MPESRRIGAQTGLQSAAAQLGGYVRPHHGQQSREVITLSATGQLGMAAPGQIQLTVVSDLRVAVSAGCWVILRS